MMFQKSACIETLYTELPFLERFRAAGADGFEFVEFWSWTDKDLAAVKAAADAAGVGISGFNGDAELSLIDPAQKTAYKAFLRRSLDAARRIGARSVTVHSNGLGEGGRVLCPYDDLSDAVKLCTMFDTLKIAAEWAENCGVQINLEPLNVTTDHPGNFLRHTRTAAELTRLIGSPYLKVLYDVYHMQLNEGSLCDHIRAYADQFGHIHVADAPGRHEPGTGEIHYPAVFAALEQAGYRGLIGYELFPKPTRKPPSGPSWRTEKGEYFMKTIKIGIIGAGRIGRVHAENIAKFVPEMEIKTIADPYMSEETVEFLRRLRIPNIVKDADVILNDPEIKAVVVCSPTDFHAEYAIKVAEAGKDVFVEKPVDYRIDRVKEVIAAAKKAGVKLQVGFNRRFDHNHRAVYEAIRAGKVGKVNLVKISSRDPEPPTIDYVKVSGGIFYDMMVHDFDMARFLAGSEVTEVFAYGAVLVDPAIGEAGDVDTAVVSLKFANGAMGVIDNSRKAVYGYDQRVEVFGSEGAVMDENDTPNNATYYGADGTSSSLCYKIMWDRYTMAFAAEQRAFAEAVINGTETQVTGEDGLAPILIAAAATKSMKEGRPVKISEIEG